MSKKTHDAFYDELPKKLKNQTLRITGRSEQALQALLQCEEVDYT
jgi:hypothetical protein